MLAMIIHSLFYLAKCKSFTLYILIKLITIRRLYYLNVKFVIDSLHACTGIKICIGPRNM